MRNLNSEETILEAIKAVKIGTGVSDIIVRGAVRTLEGDGQNFPLTVFR
jgi:hypothetical protein